MKKFLMLSMLICGAMSGAFAGSGSCGINAIVLSGINQDPSDDEFLFENKTAYDSAPKTNGSHSIKGKVWECDNEYCSGGTTVTMSPGHVFEGEVVDKAVTYECYTGGWYQSHWSQVDLVCGETHISFDGNQEASDDEFLFSSQTAYDSVKNRGDGGTVAGGLVYECDDAHCTDNKVQNMAAGHVFKGEVINEAAKYRCVANSFDVGDRWERIYDGCSYNGHNIKIGDWYVDSGNKRVALSYAECAQFQDMNPVDIDKKFNAKCEVVGGENKMRCYLIGGGTNPVNPNPNPGPNPNPNPGPSVLEKCLASRNTEEGKACCYLPNSVAIWDGKECDCVIEGMDFKIENGRGQCVAEQTNPGEVFKCNAGQLALFEGWLDSCKDKPTIVSTINKIKVLCASPNITMEDFNALWTVLMSLNPGECGAQPDLPPLPQVDDGADKLRVSIRIIRDAHSNLSGMAEGFKVSVWKDDEGKFNTSRLVSDSVAGVVLGTAGGLITSNVVKKNQVENGFEDLKCTIGGQVVADWGDQFRVGIQ